MKESVHKLKSVHLGNERTVWICEPEARADTDRLTIFLDGEFYRDRVGAMSVIRDLPEGIADSWVVFVSMHSLEARALECPCHPPFAKFAVEELLPWLGTIDDRMTRAGHKILTGLSYTGLAAAFVAKEFPGIFQKVISQSGSFWFDDCRLVKQFKALPSRLPTEFYLDVGSKETDEGVQHGEDVVQVVSQVEGVRRFRDVLLDQGCPVTYVEFDGGHEFESWRQALPGALKWAWPNTP